MSTTLSTPCTLILVRSNESSSKLFKNHKKFHNMIEEFEQYLTDHHIFPVSINKNCNSYLRDNTFKAFFTTSDAVKVIQWFQDRNYSFSSEDNQ